MELSELVKAVYHDFKLGKNDDFLLSVRTAKNAEEFAALAHFGLGMSIRNRYSLWNENSKWNFNDAKGNPIHPDDISHLVLIEVYYFAKRMLES